MLFIHLSVLHTGCRFAVLFRTNTLTEVTIASTRTSLLTLIGSSLGVIGTLVAIFVVVKRRVCTTRCGNMCDRCIVAMLTCDLVSRRSDAIKILPLENFGDATKEPVKSNAVPVSTTATGATSSAGAFVILSPLRSSVKTEQVLG